MHADLIARAAIVETLSAKDKKTALEEVLGIAAREKFVTKKQVDALGARLLAREALGSTGIGNGVAIPHVKSEDIKSLGIVVARSERGLDYQAIDGKPVHTLFLLLAPTAQAEQHLAALRWISGLARNGDFRRFFLAAKSAEEIRELLREMSQTP